MFRYFRAGVLARLALAALALGGMLHAHAAGYPDRPVHLVHLVVAYPAGGATDSGVRILAEYLGKLWEQPVVVENKAGASGRLAVAQVGIDPTVVSPGAVSITTGQAEYSCQGQTTR